MNPFVEAKKFLATPEKVLEYRALPYNEFSDSSRKARAMFVLDNPYELTSALYKAFLATPGHRATFDPAIDYVRQMQGGWYIAAWLNVCDIPREHRMDRLLVQAYLHRWCDHLIVEHNQRKLPFQSLLRQPAVAPLPSQRTAAPKLIL